MDQVAIEFINLHVFCEASMNATCPVVYAVLCLESNEVQGLVSR